MPHHEPSPVTDDYPVITEDILGTLHRMAHQVDAIYAVLAPVIEAYQRGGPLAARTAMRRLGKV